MKTNPERIEPEGWLMGRYIDRSMLSCRAVFCIEDVIKRSNEEQIAVVEVGPKPPLEVIQRAPIGLLHERNPKLRCISIGCHELSEEQRRILLGDVEYIHGILSPGSSFQRDGEILVEKLGQKPNIIYGQHVFEDSSGPGRLLPLGPYKPFEKSAEILADSGFIIVDNYGGRLGQVGIHSDWPHSSKMRHVFSYMYGEEFGIYVFRKS